MTVQGLSPHRRVFDRHHIFEGLRTRPGIALDHMEVLARALKIRLRAEIGDVDHQGVALPMAAGVPVPLADAPRQMRAAVHDDVALAALALAHVVEHRHSARRLHDAAEAVAADLRHARGQAAIRQRAVLRAVMAIHPRGIVTWRRVGKPRRGRRIIFTAGAGDIFDLAGFGRLQQGETMLRSAALIFCASGVSAGNRPLAGSTIRDVRAPVCRLVPNN